MTRGLGEKFQRFTALGLKVPAPDAKIFVVDTINELINKLNSILAPTTNMAVKAHTDMAEEIIAKASRLKLSQHSNIFQNAFSVSTCPEIANLRDGGSLYVNRIIDETGEVIGVGPRPGAPSIDDQFSAIRKIAEGRPIVIIEDGSFTGGTMKFIVQEMAKHGIKINALIIGLVFPKARKELSGIFDGEIIACDDGDNYLDWMPDYDFFPFTPGSGRVFGLSWRGNPIPLYSRDGATFCAPYIKPFSPAEKWANIPEKHAADFSKFCMEKSMAIFERMCELNGRRLTIGDIIGATPHVSIPLRPGQKALPDIGAPVLDYLAECLAEIN